VKRYTLEQHNKEIIDGCFFNYKSSRFRWWYYTYVTSCSSNRTRWYLPFYIL
jgi:hypothetical protein